MNMLYVTPPPPPLTFIRPSRRLGRLSEEAVHWLVSTLRYALQHQRFTTHVFSKHQVQRRYLHPRYLRTLTDSLSVMR